MSPQLLSTRPKYVYFPNNVRGFGFTTSVLIQQFACRCSQTTITLMSTAEPLSQLMSTKQQWRQERDDVRHCVDRSLKALMSKMYLPRGGAGRLMTNIVPHNVE